MEKQFSNFSYEKYDNFERIISYANQIKLVNDLDAESCLEVGVGTGFFNTYLRTKKISVVTLDINKDLNPDIVGDIRNIFLADNSFDLVCAFEVLEHLPYEESLVALRELKRVSKKHVVISVPKSCIYNALFCFFGIPTWRKFFSLDIRIPFFWIRASFGNKQHFWELGRRKYSTRRFLADVKKIGFRVLHKGHTPLNTQHYFVVLEK